MEIETKSSDKSSPFEKVILQGNEEFAIQMLKTAK